MIRHSYRSLLCLLCGCVFPLLAWPAPLPPVEFGQRPEVRAFIDMMVAQYGFARDDLVTIFDRITPDPAVLNAISRPAESKPWYQYRPLLVTPERILAGAQFWREHRGTLQKTTAIYGVDPAVIVAIIGVETHFGSNTGSYSALRALATLAFDYPSRGTFFRSELENLLLLAREESLDPLNIRSSYAGALGRPQFMPDSFRSFAVDFDEDGHRDIWSDWDDVIGSIANFLKQHGWETNGLLAIPAALPSADPPPGSIPGPVSAGQLRDRGFVFSQGLANDTEVRLVTLAQADGPDYWVALHDFGVIQSYNRSPLYAMAVAELAYRTELARAAQPHE